MYAMFDVRNCMDAVQIKPKSKKRKQQHFESEWEEKNVLQWSAICYNVMELRRIAIEGWEGRKWTEPIVWTDKLNISEKQNKKTVANKHTNEYNKTKKKK